MLAKASKRRLDSYQGYLDVTCIGTAEKFLTSAQSYVVFVCLLKVYKNTRNLTQAI